MVIDLVGSDGEGVGTGFHYLVVAIRDAELVEPVVKLDEVVLGRAMADGIDRRYCPSAVIMACHAGVGMFVAL